MCAFAIIAQLPDAALSVQTAMLTSVHLQHVNPDARGSDTECKPAINKYMIIFGASESRGFL